MRQQDDGRPEADEHRRHKPQQGEEGGNQLQELLSTLNSGLSILAEVLGEANPELAKEAMALKQGYDALVGKMTGEAGQEPSGPVPMEQGVNGQPMNPAM